MISPTDKNMRDMWQLMKGLFPIYRSLAGSGFLESIKKVQKHLPIVINEFASGAKVFDWVIPKEFKVNSSYVIDPNGKKIFDFNECSYHLYIYSQPFHGEMEREELIKHIATSTVLPDAIPLCATYYRKKWGICASQKQVAALPKGRYKVHIDTEHIDGALCIGEYLLPGETKEEILITSYLCHPLGANDNLSGVVVATELFKMLSQLPKLHYSYRLAIWPETIGSITYIHNYPQRLKHTLGGYALYCLGDDESGLFHYYCSYQGCSLLDRVMIYALKQSGYKYVVLSKPSIYSDDRQFNGSGLRIPFGVLTRTPPGQFSAYHTSYDDLKYIKQEILFKSLQIYWRALMTLEKNRIYKGNFKVEPFLTRHGIFPFDLGLGEGTARLTNKDAGNIADAFYYLMWGVDGKMDLLDIAEKAGIDIDFFDRAVKEFLRAGLMEAVSKKRNH